MPIRSSRFRDLLPVQAVGHFYLAREKPMTTIITVMKIINQELLDRVTEGPVPSQTSSHPDDYDPSRIKPVVEEEVIPITPEPNQS